MRVLILVAPLLIGLAVGLALGHLGKRRAVSKIRAVDFDVLGYARQLAAVDPMENPAAYQLARTELRFALDERDRKEVSA